MNTLEALREFLRLEATDPDFETTLEVTADALVRRVKERSAERPSSNTLPWDHVEGEMTQRGLLKGLLFSNFVAKKVIVGLRGGDTESVRRLQP